MQKTRYYLVSYAHEKGFGNAFYEATPFLDIRAAEKDIAERHPITGKAIIISINEIKKEQYFLTTNKQ